MTKEILLMQYQSECRSALKSVVNICKPFEKTFMDAMKLFMAILDRINFLQLGSYGRFSEQTYRNLSYSSDIRWMEGQTSGSCISLRTIHWMHAKFWITAEPCFSWNSALETACSMQESPTVSQRISESWRFISMHHSRLSTWPKRMQEARNDIFHFLMQVNHI